MTEATSPDASTMNAAVCRTALMMFHRTHAVSNAARAAFGSVAREFGYGSAFALSAAFKRRRGVSPREFRR